MAAVVRHLSDSLRIMRLAIARRNQNDPDSSDAVLMQYIQDFVSLTMSDDLKIFENFSTLIFEIDETNTTGVYTFNDVGASFDFVNISCEAFISLTDPPNNSVSWNQLSIFQDPGYFFSLWGVNNDEILIPGYPTMMLFYGNEMTFRTIPNTSYKVYIYGYKQIPQFSEEGDPDLPHAYWMRYLAYGAAKNYAADYNFDSDHAARIQNGYMREKKLLLTHTHNQIKISRCLPRF